KEKPPPVPPRWPPLYRPSRPLDLPALRQEAEGPFAAPVVREAPVVRAVRRLPEAGGFAGLRAACAALPAGKPVGLEVNDNGPIFAGPLAVEGRDVTVKAGKGFRPLIVFDVGPALEARKKGPGGPLVFLKVGKGRLVLEGIDLAVRWPDGANEAATLLQ